MIGLRDLEGLFGALRGRGFPLLLALQGFLGSLQLLGALGFPYYPMVHRETGLVRFDLGVSLAVPLGVLLVAWGVWVVRGRWAKLVVVPVLGLLLFPVLGVEGCLAVASLVAVGVGLWSGRCFGFFFWVLFGLLSVLEGLALVHWVVFVPLGWVSPVEGVAMLEMGLFYVSGYLAPLLVLPFLFMWLLRPLMRWGLGIELDTGSSMLVGEGLMSRRAVWLLVLSVCLGVFSALYPYLPVVNPDGQGVGVDYPRYVEAAEMVEEDLSQVFNVLGGSRPLIFLFIRVFQSLLRLDVSVAVKFLPVFLNPLLAVSVFFMAFETFRDDWIAAYAAFFTVSGIQIVVGMYAYYLTNLLGLSIVFISLGFFFRALRLNCRRSLVYACLAGSLLVFTHPWSFDQYFAPLILTAGLLWYDSRDGGEPFDSWMVLVYIASLAFSEVLKIVLFRGYGGISATSTALGGLSELWKFWYDSIFGFRLRWGGTIASVVLLGLCVVGISVLGRIGFSGMYIAIFPAATSLLFLIGNEAIKSRLLFNVSFGLFAACGFIFLSKQKGMDDFRGVFVSFVVLNMVVYLFRSLANLVPMSL